MSPAPKGNQFWKIRSKHGRDKLFKTPELMWEAATEYFQWVDDHKWEKVETTIRGKNIDVKTVPTERPYTITGLCIYLDCSSHYFRSFKETLKEKDKDFLPVITRIEEIIYTQKFEGAAVGSFNANIIARDLGLKDGIDHTTKGDKLSINVTVDNSDTAKTLQKLRDGQTD